jgi:hypothetical protein
LVSSISLLRPKPSVSSERRKELIHVFIKI